jgi:hypothetical protein
MIGQLDGERHPAVGERQVLHESQPHDVFLDIGIEDRPQGVQHGVTVGHGHIAILPCRPRGHYLVTVANSMARRGNRRCLGGDGVDRRWATRTPLHAPLDGGNGVAGERRQPPACRRAAADAGDPS